MSDYEYRSAVSGLWYENPKAAGAIDAMREAGVPCSDWRIAPDDEGEICDLQCQLAAVCEDRDEAVSQLDTMIESNRMMRDRLAHLEAIMRNSDGVAGWHQNGSVATWAEFPELEATDG